ncbi:dynein axonemal assembly factor 6 [Halyomorpha halys]|uniref:dynein axonemal assembly factor 6 n=1 Tax=Halyomorpha halys TaxID=286706 RepID=UPI0006D51FF0|nr:protein PIH1D3 [Halyomorpha halys]
MTPSDLQSLSQLLKCNGDESSSSDDELPRTGYSTMGPGDIFQKVKITGNEAGHNNQNTIPDDPKSIWYLSEVQEVPISDDALWDPREKPKYDIIYKQALKPEDIYLQMSNKNPTSASCENLVITVTMKGESKTAIDCNVTRTNLDIRSPMYRLNLPLPHPIDPDSATAEWHCSSSQLIISLQMKREYDFMNF